jgi:hypothetical protein
VWLMWATLLQDLGVHNRFVEWGGRYERVNNLDGCISPEVVRSSEA